ncbi:hypothetical protein [Bifidobacterium olomucense]|uniref:Uncharacterized protein n=1 Tax=Bifidobacterium olomucense TaxID=2675324 RepID=A0A7Y0EWB0_9BIFI|nr:hypothetical protein [Bifidobacterium sp. DSM 109959]NMM97612.1 hypothetical protein [Bifidobacterium sp. DSM 109959]
MVGWGTRRNRHIQHDVRYALALLISVSLITVCAACGSPSSTTANGNAAQSNAAACKAPDFAGPFANEFQSAYEQSKTDLAKRILADCRITDAELNEILDVQNDCLAPYGLVATKGQLARLRDSALTDDEMNQKNTECAEKTDLWNVEALHDEIQGNPGNLDTEAFQKAAYQCLKQRDLLPKPLSEQEYLAMEVSSTDSETRIEEKTRKWNEFYSMYMEYNEDGSRNPDYNADKAQQFWACQQDPLHQ